MMTETRTVHDPFLGKDVQVSDRLVDRLRGRYAQGPTMENGEPEFGWREFPGVPPIQREAASEIENLREAIEIAVRHIEHMAAWITKANADYHVGVYSFESLGEDLPGIREALGKPAK